MTTIEQIIANFKGTTFSSHEDVEKWLRQALEQNRKETIEECEKAVPKEEKLPKSKCMNLENHMFGSCFACEKIKGFNTCRSETLANIQALRNLDKL